MKVLIIRMSSLGDVVLATPAARAVKKAHPDARVHFLVERPYAPLLAGVTCIDEVIGLDKRGADGGMEGTLRLGRRLRAEKYDVIVDLQHKVRSSLLAFLAGPETRIVLRKRTLRRSITELARIAGPACEAHTVDMYLAVLAQIGVPPDGRVPEVHLDGAAKARVATEIARSRNGHRALVGFNVGAGNATKRLPVFAVREAAASLQAQGLGVVLIGARNDSGSIYDVASALRQSPVLTAHNYTVQELAAVIGQIDVLVSGDSGPVHIASALGVPAVTVYGPTSPVRWGPISARHEVIWHRPPCAPCSNHGSARCPENRDLECMKSVRPEEIVAAVRRLLR